MYIHCENNCLSTYHCRCSLKNTTHYYTVGIKCFHIKLVLKTGFFISVVKRSNRRAQPTPPGELLSVEECPYQRSGKYCRYFSSIFSKFVSHHKMFSRIFQVKHKVVVIVNNKFQPLFIHVCEDLRPQKPVKRLKRSDQILCTVFKQKVYCLLYICIISCYFASHFCRPNHFNNYQLLV